MKSIRYAGVLVAAVVSALAMAVGATAASAHEFHATKEGKIKSTQTGNQVFTIGTGLTEGTVTCTTAKGEGQAKLTAEHQKVTVAYTGCTFKDFAGSGKSSEPINAEYEFNANNEEVKILNEIEIKISAPSCTIKVPPTGNEKLKAVEYRNLGTEALKNRRIEEVSKVTGITYTTNCIGNGTNGKYSGNNIVEGEGFEVFWT